MRVRVGARAGSRARRCAADGAATREVTPLMPDRIPGAALRILPEEGHVGGIGAAHEIFDAMY